MQKVKLNSKQITELVKYKKALISDNIAIEVFDDELIYNDNGTINYITAMSLEFEKNSPPDDYMQQLICDHFHLEPHNVIIENVSPEDGEFRIRFTPNKELFSIVCPINIAIINSTMSKKEMKNAPTASHIGVYRRLGNSCYFFRWDMDTDSAKW